MPLFTSEGVEYFVGGDAPNLAVITLGMASSLKGRIIAVFPDSATRTAAWTGGATPADGQLSYQQDTKRLERYWAAATTWSPQLTNRVQVKRSAVQSIPTGGTPTGVGWDTVDYNPGSLTQSAAGVTVLDAGWKEVVFMGEFAPNATGRRFTTILKNGAEVTSLNRHTVPVNSGTNGAGLMLPGVAVNFAVGDVISVGVFQDSGAALNLSVNATMLVRPAT